MNRDSGSNANRRSGQIGLTSIRFFAAFVLPVILASCLPGGTATPMPTKTPPPTERITATPTSWRAGDVGFGNVAGRVTDSVTGEPVAGAVVTCQHFSYFPEAPCDGERVTDENGNFAFENVFFHNTDSISLTIEADGYVTQNTSDYFFTQPGLDMNVALEPVLSADFPFRRMTFTANAFPEDAILFDLWIAPPGHLWVTTDAGLYAYNTGGFGPGHDLPLTQVIGWQEEPFTIWALGADGGTIHAFDGETWTVYGPAEGWEPTPYGIDSDEPAVTPDGAVWLATGSDDLRRFDPASGTWSSLQATDLGFAPADPDYQGHYLTDTVVLPDGSLWVSDCIGWGEGFDGQGARAMQNGSWTAVPETEGQCIFELAMDPAGRVWIGGEEALLIHDPATGARTEIALPPWDRPQYVTDLVLAPSGEPWIGLLRCGPACCDTFALYAHEADGWHEVRATSAEALYLIPSITFEPDGTPWTCSLGEVMRWPGGEGERVGQVGYGRCEIIADDEGTLWVATLDEPGGLWRIIP